MFHKVTIFRNTHHPKIKIYKLLKIDFDIIHVYKLDALQIIEDLRNKFIKIMGEMWSEFP